MLVAVPAVILYGIYRPSLSFSRTHKHARTDTHKGLLISWPFLYSWYVLGEEMIGQIRHLVSCHTHVVCMCIQDVSVAVTLFYSYAPTCTARLQWVSRAPGSGNDSDCSKETRIQHSQNHFLISYAYWTVHHLDI